MPTKLAASLNLTLKDRGVQLDGKTLRGSFDTASGKAALHLVNAWSNDLQACLARVAVDQESNEITAVPKLLEMLELTGAVVTLYAMHCQTETAQAIRNEWADYILTVQGNQPTLHETIQRLFEEAGYLDYEVPGLRDHTTTNESHGRSEQREYFVGHPGSVWVEVESAAVEVDGGFEVFPVPTPTDSPLDGHDLAVDSLSHGVRDSVIAVTHDVCQPLLDGVRDSD